jgi:hypothetical protein
MNRNLWGVENFWEITIRHLNICAQRLAQEADPALTSCQFLSCAIVSGIKAVRERIVARTDKGP